MKALGPLLITNNEPSKAILSTFRESKYSITCTWLVQLLSTRVATPYLDSSCSVLRSLDGNVHDCNWLPTAFIVPGRDTRNYFEVLQVEANNALLLNRCTSLAFSSYLFRVGSS